MIDASLESAISLANGIPIGRLAHDGRYHFAFSTSLTEDQCLDTLGPIGAETGYWVLQDIGVNSALRAVGDSLEKEREIQHWARFPFGTARNALLACRPDGVNVCELRYRTDDPGLPFEVL